MTYSTAIPASLLAVTACWANLGTLTNPYQMKSYHKWSCLNKGILSQTTGLASKIDFCAILQNGVRKSANVPYLERLVRHFRTKFANE